MAWLLPTRKRLSNCARYFAAMKAMETTTPGYVLVNKDDLQANKAAYDALEMPPGWRIIPCDGDAQGDKIRETEHLWWQDEWTGLTGDDQIVMTPHWDQLFLARLNGWNMITCDDGWTRPKRVGSPDTPRGRMAGFICWSGPLLRAVGCMFAPGMQHTYLDDMWEQIGTRAGCWEMELGIFIDHPHYQNGRTPEDETYTKAYAYGPIDVSSWHIWRQDHLDAAVQRIFDLREQIEGAGQ